MSYELTDDARWLHAVAGMALLAALIPQNALLAQGLESPEAIETIIGSDVNVAQSDAAEEADALIAALDNTVASTGEVRRKFTLDTVQIVFVPDVADAASPVARKVEERRQEISELHQAIEGNAMLYHAADSHSIMVRDIVALQFDDANGVRIYAAGEAPSE